MNHRAPKQRSVCRYYSSESNTCYYGDACQFQHPPADHHPPVGVFGVVQQRQGPIVGPVVPTRPGEPPAMRGPMALGPPPAEAKHFRLGRGCLPLQTVNAHKNQVPRLGNLANPQRPPSSYRSSLFPHASNPPKHRMGPLGVGGVVVGGASMGGHPIRPHPGMLRSPPQKKEKELFIGGRREDEKVSGQGGGEKEGKDGGNVDGQKEMRQVLEEKKTREGERGSVRREGSGSKSNGGTEGKKQLDVGEDVRRSASEGSGRSGSGFGFTALQPPPASKQNKTRGTASNQSQVQAGGTTYFYSGQQPSYGPDFTVYSGPLAHLSSSKSSSSPLSSSQAAFFLSENLRQELQQQQLSCLTMPASKATCPREVDKYHSLCPLEPIDNAAPDQEVKRIFGHPSTCYRGICQKDGLFYCLRRIHGFRLLSTKAVQELDKWKQLDHVNLVSLKEMFTTKAFGDHSVVFVYDFHPAAETLREKHWRHTKRKSALPEDLVWEYVVQLASAMRLVHSRQLALRCLDPSKVLVSSRQRLRINGCGIMDMMTYDSSSSTSASPTMHQQGDLCALGQLLVSVSLQSAEAGRPEHLHHSIEAFSSIYSPDLNRLTQYLLQSGSKTPPNNIMEVLSMISGQLHCSLERSLLRADLLEQELSKELQNGRLFRVLAKLGAINERPEFANDEQWAETGDRYLLKLLRDYLFHQVHPSGAPWINLAHIVQTLNKIEAGTYESIALHSRDEQSVLVVSYADLKLCLENSFSELLSASSNHSTAASSSGRGINGHTLK